MRPPTNFEVIAWCHEELVERSQPPGMGMASLMREGYPVLRFMTEADICAMMAELGALPRGDTWEPEPPPRLSLWRRFFNWLDSWT